MVDKQTDPYVTAITAMVQEIGPEKAELSIQSSGSYCNFDIRPDNPNAAPISGVVTEGVAFIRAGFTGMELFTKAGYEDRQQIADLIEICVAVCHGNFEETIWYSGEVVLHTRAIFHLKEGPFNARSTHLSLRWLARKSRRVCRYEPY